VTASDLHAARERTLTLVAGLDDDELHRRLDPIMSPLVWDLGHIAAYEDLWLVHRLGGEPLLRPDLAAVYDAFETPRAVRHKIELLRRDEALEYMTAVRERTLEVLDRTGPSDLHEMVLRHELQHTETMRQAMFLGGLAGGTARELPYCDPEPEWVAVAGGTFEMGARDDGFAYDNERPRHPVALGAFRISRTPVSNASYGHFVEGGGYERREWWTDEGWAWKEDHDITRPLGWDEAELRADAPVQHVSWFEADAFARSLGAQLPSEAQWERAAAPDQEGRLAGAGAVWEWTADEFDGYPGFRARPYREYSEVFFGRGYRVLRGGCWASSPRVATRTFRNWDLPVRRQIFSGIRLVHAG
jgi:iron(II)-dependent oxidoreductase